jgi:hypothetical protein
MKKSEHQQPTNTDSSSKPQRRDFRLAKPLPADHPIYKEGPRFGFVGALPGSIKRLQTKASEALTPSPADSSETSV